MNNPKLIKREQILKQEQTPFQPSVTTNAKSMKSTVSEWMCNRQAREINPRTQFAALFTQSQPV